MRSHGISFVIAKENYTDIYDFATTSNNLGQINYYLNNQDLLYNFFQEYLNKFAPTLNNLEKQPLVIIPTRPKEFRIEKSVAPTFAKLTKREIDCLELLSKGLTAKMIGKFLILSPRTVERHLDNIREKVNLKSKVELAIGYKTWLSSNNN